MWENEVVIACSSFHFEDFIATAPSDNIFVNENGGGTNGAGTNGDKWPKMAKNGPKWIYLANGRKMG